MELMERETFGGIRKERPSVLPTRPRLLMTLFQLCHTDRRPPRRQGCSGKAFDLNKFGSLFVHRSLTKVDWGHGYVYIYIYIHIHLSLSLAYQLPSEAGEAPARAGGCGTGERERDRDKERERA